MDNYYPSGRSNVLKFPHDPGEEDTEMQVKCTECNSKAIISSRNELDPKVADLYCICRNPHCGHSFVMKLTYSHTLSPSSFQARRMATDIFRGLPKSEQLELLQQLQASA